jgi:hypothetical protein
VAEAIDVTRQAASGATQGISVDKATARKMVLVGTLVLAGINVYRSKKGTGTSVSFYKRMWGTGVVGVMLATLADFAPQVAGPFIVLVDGIMLTKYGDGLFGNALSKGASTVHPTSPGGASPGGPGR